LTILDVISGLKWKHFFEESTFRGFNLESFFLLDNSLVTLPSTACEIVMISRQKAAGKKLTWIGLYRSLPASLNYRPGDYFGAGLWIADGAVDAQGATKLLRRVLTRVFQSMQAESRRAWDLRNITATGFHVPQDEMAELIERDCAIAETGSETICVDLSAEQESFALETAIDDAQDDLDGRYNRFSRILLSSDEAIIMAVRKLGRVAVRKPAEIVAIRRPAETQERRAARDGKQRAAARLTAAVREHTAMQASSREPTGVREVNAESDIFRLRRDMSRLTNEMAASRAESAKSMRDMRQSVAAFVSAGALAVAALALAIACVTYFSLGTIQVSLRDSLAKMTKLEERIAILEKGRHKSPDSRSAPDLLPPSAAPRFPGVGPQLPDAGPQPDGKPIK
jgi:hypothetical protein